MVFFDTCVWIELLGVSSPITEKEETKARLVSQLLLESVKKNETIVTFSNQILELISATLKIKMREYNRYAKENGKKGVSNLKEFRKTREYQDAKLLCKSICDDIKHFAKSEGNFEFSFDGLLNNLDIADINDSIYYQFCEKNNCNLYTFDYDLLQIDNKSLVIHLQQNDNR